MLRSLLILGLTAALTSFGQSDWPQKLKSRLPLLGHRNWIVIADSAYPLQSAPGIETIATDADHLQVLQDVLAMLAKSKHVRPIIYADAELTHVAEKNAPGIRSYREALATMCAGQQVNALPHEQIIAKLDEAGRSFVIVVLKTRLTLPYTSVFLQLDCGYWNASSETELRAIIQAAAGHR